MSSKKYRFRDGTKRRIKEHLNRKRAKILGLLHDDSLSSLTSCTDTEDEALVEKYKTSNCSKSSHLVTIVERLWTYNSVGSNKNSEKVYSPEHPSCFLRRNIKAIDKKRRLGHKTPTPRKNRRLCATFHKKKKITTAINSGPDFYFTKRHSIHSEARSNNTDTDSLSAPMTPETVEIGRLESDKNYNIDLLDSVQKEITGGKRTFETCFVEERPELDPQEKQLYYRALFPKRACRWRSLVKENDNCLD